MKFLILTDKTKGSATGIVTRNIIQGLLNIGQTAHILSEYPHTSFENIQNLKVFTINCKKVKASNFFSELCLLLFKHPLNETDFIRKATKKARSLNSKFAYDVVMVLSSAAGFHLLNTGVNIKRKTKLPLYIHATDPIPAPKPWYNTQILRDALIRAARKSYRKADVISLSNKHMLAYQKQIMRVENTPSFVVQNPSSNQKIIQKLDANQPIIFLYVGSIYHQRQPDILLKSFEKFSIHQNVEFWFLGKHEKLDLNSLNLSEETLNKIKLLDFQDDPSQIIQKANVLVDFDANFKNDVFISSKLITYLNTNIPILSLTPKNSPTDQLTKDVNLGVVKMYYEDQNKILSFQKALDLGKTLPENLKTNRDKLIAEFDKTSIAKVILNYLQNELYKSNSEICSQ